MSNETHPANSPGNGGYEHRDIGVAPRGAVSSTRRAGL